MLPGDGFGIVSPFRICLYGFHASHPISVIRAYPILHNLLVINGLGKNYHSPNRTANFSSPQSPCDSKSLKVSAEVLNSCINLKSAVGSVIQKSQRDFVHKPRVGTTLGNLAHDRSNTEDVPEYGDAILLLKPRRLA